MIVIIDSIHVLLYSPCISGRWVTLSIDGSILAIGAPAANTGVFVYFRDGFQPNSSSTSPTNRPTARPSQISSRAPTAPSVQPSLKPTSPSMSPSVYPTALPSVARTFPPVSPEVSESCLGGPWSLRLVLIDAFFLFLLGIVGGSIPTVSG